MEKNTWYYDIHEKIYIDAVFKNGKLVDSKTNQTIILKDNTKVRIATPAYGMKDEEAKKYKELKRKLFLQKGSDIYFHFFNDNRLYEFKVILLNNLFLIKKGTQNSKLEHCKCMVYIPNEYDKIDFETDSLNQTYTKASIKYRPNNKSHTCNVFKTFKFNGKFLEDIRFY